MLEVLKSKAKKTRERIMAYEPLASEPEDTGAHARHVEQSVPLIQTPLNVPEGQFTVSEYARGSGISRYKAGFAIKDLIEKKLIEVVPSNKKRKLYQIIGQGPNLSKDTTPAVPSGREEENIDFVNITNDLIWSFIRATRSTDVLLYLTWLERQKEEGNVRH